MTTILHEWGYFHVIGLTYEALLTPTDYLVSAIYWLPLNIGLLCGAFIFGAITSSRSFSGIWHGGQGKFLRRMRAALFVLIGLAVISAIVNGSMSSIVLVAPLPALFYIELARARGRITASTSLVLIIAVLSWSVLVGTFILAERDARRDLVAFTPVHRIELKNGAVKWVVILRNLEKGILAHNKTAGQIEFVRWEEFASVATKSPDLRRRHFCEWLGFWCGEVFEP